MNDLSNPGFRAALDQKIAQAIDNTLVGAALYDGMDFLDAVTAFATDMVEAEVDARTAITMAAGLALRLHRSGGIA